MDQFFSLSRLLWRIKNSWYTVNKTDLHCIALHSNFLPTTTFRAGVCGNNGTLRKLAHEVVAVGTSCWIPLIFGWVHPRLDNQTMGTFAKKRCFTPPSIKWPSVGLWEESSVDIRIINPLPAIARICLANKKIFKMRNSLIQNLTEQLNIKTKARIVITTNWL